MIVSIDYWVSPHFRGGGGGGGGVLLERGNQLIFFFFWKGGLFLNEEMVKKKFIWFGGRVPGLVNGCKKNGPER